MTYRNAPGFMPPEETAAEEEARVAGRVSGFLEDATAGHRVESGLVDPYFYDLRKALTRAAANPPPVAAKAFERSLLTTLFSTSRRYGATGNPFAPSPLHPSDRDLDARTYSGLQSFLDRPNMDTNALRAAQGMATLQKLMEEVASNGPRTVIEVRQDRQGQFVSASILESSGNKAFDAHALAAVPKALEALPPPPPDGSGIHADGIRSVWAFEGRVTFQKDVKKLKAGDLLAILPLLPVLGGSFDLVTGDVAVNSLGPSLQCKARLLRVY
jgi:TonB family protein